MKHLSQLKINLIRPVFLLLVSVTGITTYAQQKIPDNVKQKLLQLYKGIRNPERSFEQFAESNSHIFINNQNSVSSANRIAAAAAQDPYCSKVRPYCIGGTFENGLDTSQYTGAYGVWSSGLYPDPFSLTYGFSSGPITSSAAHQTIVDTSQGKDSITGVISLTPAGGGAKSLRLGNIAVNRGTELIAKTLVVDANETVLNFYYAPVLQDPGHAFQDQPAFSVRAYDCATGQELPNVVDLGNGSNIVVASANNPFFKSFVHPTQGLVVYRDWSLAQINLSQYIGKTVIIVFTNKDCNLGGHWGYTYLDNLFSSQCPVGPVTTNQGSISLDPTRVDTCGSGQICAKYSLPFRDSSGTTTTGTIQIKLRIYQNDTLVDSLSSAVLTQDTSYCFSINPAQLNINHSLPGFDYTITGSFTLSGFALSPIILGNPPRGVKSGVNNDYYDTCGGTGTCTPPTFLNDGTIVLDASCGGNDGSVTIWPTSGTAPFMYSINGGATYEAGPSRGYTFMNLSAGDYQLRLKDAAGCESAIVTRRVRNYYGGPAFLNDTTISVDASCGGRDGKITIKPTCGAAPFMYSINGGTTYVSGPDSGYTFTNLSAGSYFLRLKDADGRESPIVERSIHWVYGGPTFSNDGTIVRDASCGQSDGNISILPTSGTPFFRYSIDGGITYILGPATGYTFMNLPAGTYQLRLMDAHGCESPVLVKTVRNYYNCPPTTSKTNTSDVLLPQSKNNVVLSESKETLISFPNPNNGEFKLQLQNFASPKAEVFIIDAQGAIIQKRSLNLSKGTTSNFNLKGKAPGLYNIKVVTSNGTKVSKVLIQ
jgi:hypothetical protein